MATQLSPGINSSEVSLDTIVPSVATSDIAISGLFRWGPVGQITLTDSETTLVSKFGKPSNFNAETWFVAADALAYTNKVHVVRAANTSGANPSATFQATSGNNVVVGNTTGINVGMYVYQSSSANVVPTALTVASVNSSALVLSGNSVATGNSTLYFGDPATAYTAVAIDPTAVVANLVNQIVRNDEHYTTKDGTFDTDAVYVARYPGALGNSLRISVCDNATSYSSAVSTNTANVNYTIGSNTATIANVASLAAATTIAGSLSIGDKVFVGNSSIGSQYLTVTSVATSGNTITGNVTITFQDPYRLHTPFTSNTINRFWEFSNSVGVAPGQSNFQLDYGNTAVNDELHVVVVDEKGQFTGVPGTILEVYQGLSRATDAKNDDNSVNYYKEVINQNSQYVWFANDRSTAPSATASALTASTSTAPGNYYFYFGADGYDETNDLAFSSIAAGYSMFASVEDIDVSIILQGRAIGGSTSIGGETVTGFQLANFIIDNILEQRKDAVGTFSPAKYTVVGNVNDKATSIKNWKGAVRSSSYTIFDSGYKWRYDRYNDLFRWIPMNGDIAGLMARTDLTNDAWWSPAGYNRGQIKNVVKLAFNPNKPQRDILYSANINPVVTFPGEGTILYGDKTGLAKPSSFDRINVRRLFIVLEKAISKAAKYSLFEFNDPFTRSQFRNSVIPYLRTIQGRRGITDFLVVCDGTNNTAQVIDANQFVGDIYIKPAKSNNFIQLNFVSVGTGVQLSEVIGKF